MNAAQSKVWKYSSWYKTNGTNAAIKEDKLLIERFCQKDLVSDIKEEVIQ
ncbi:hypothetical protein SMU86_09170 [Streptococcus mutans U2A]|nr:hypothetical protein SMU77_02542 [Streptococcus mutans NV1996]EMC28864.1 hypothetical protein SMU86_09170 [Streptococcus mutans U2A]EMC40282.1 hypothetical protein SMU94_01760 [Streptococcus mutans 66-2A]QFG45658.1 hypothetical protein FSA28_1241 [Streptococcus mutans]